MIKKVTGRHLGIAVIVLYFLFATSAVGCATSSGIHPANYKTIPRSELVEMCNGHTPRQLECTLVTQEEARRVLNELQGLYF